MDESGQPSTDRGVRSGSGPSRTEADRGDAAGTGSASTNGWHSPGEAELHRVATGVAVRPVSPVPAEPVRGWRRLWHPQSPASGGPSFPVAEQDYRSDDLGYRGQEGRHPSELREAGPDREARDDRGASHDRDAGYDRWAGYDREAGYDRQAYHDSVYDREAYGRDGYRSGHRADAYDPHAYENSAEWPAWRATAAVPPGSLTDQTLTRLPPVSEAGPVNGEPPYRREPAQPQERWVFEPHPDADVERPADLTGGSAGAPQRGQSSPYASGFEDAWRAAGEAGWGAEPANVEHVGEAGRTAAVAHPPQGGGAGWAPEPAAAAQTGGVGRTAEPAPAAQAGGAGRTAEPAPAAQAGEAMRAADVARAAQAAGQAHTAAQTDAAAFDQAAVQAAYLAAVRENPIELSDDREWVVPRAQVTERERSWPPVRPPGAPAIWDGMPVQSRAAAPVDAAHRLPPPAPAPDVVRVEGADHPPSRVSATVPAPPVEVGAARREAGSVPVDPGSAGPRNLIPAQRWEAGTAPSPWSAGRVPSLPRRVPAEPDVPDVPDSPDDLLGDGDSPEPASPPQLARIATHLRDDERDSDAPRPDGFDIPAVLAAVREVPGVRDARVTPNPNGAHTLRLDLADDADPALVSRAVARLLKRRMGLAAEPRRVAGMQQPSPATTGPRSDPAAFGQQMTQPASVQPGQPVTGTVASGAITPVSPDPRAWQGRPAMPVRQGAEPAIRQGAEPVRAEVAERRRWIGGTGGPRMVLDRVQVGTLGIDATVEVRLTINGVPAIGVSSGPAVDGYILRLAAQAAAGAIDQALAGADGLGGAVEQPSRCCIEHVAVFPLGTCEVAAVVVLLVIGGSVEQLAGAALVAGDPRQAIVRATLAAVNRRLDALLR